MLKWTTETGKEVLVDKEYLDTLEENERLEIEILVCCLGRSFEEAVKEYEENYIKHYIGRFDSDAECGEYLVKNFDEFPGIENCVKRIYDYIDYESVALDYMNCNAICVYNDDIYYWTDN